MKRVVVTGLGVVSPNGVGLSAFTDALRSGVSGLKFFPELRELKFRCQVMGVPQIPENAFASVLTTEQIMATNNSMRFAALAGLECWRDASLPWRMGDRHHPVDCDTAICFGTGIGGMDTIAEKVAPLTSRGEVRRLGSSAAEQAMSSNTSAILGGLLGVGGQVSTNSSACATGTEAIVNAFRQVRHGYAKRSLAGAAEGSSLFTAACFDSMRVTAHGFNDTPKRASRPLSATATGFVPGFGAGALLLESLESAQSRNARIYAEILAGAITCGGQRNGGTMNASSPDGVRRCIRAAIKESGLEPREIDYINGHLTATTADPKEIENLRCALNVADGFPWINSTKSMIGHALGASGAIESVATLLQMANGFIHPSINCEDLHPEAVSIANRIVRTQIHTTPRVAMKVSFGFGDVNACVIFSKWPSSGVNLPGNQKSYE